MSSGGFWFLRGPLKPLLKSCGLDLRLGFLLFSFTRVGLLPLWRYAGQPAHHHPTAGCGLWLLGIKGQLYRLTDFYFPLHLPQSLKQQHISYLFAVGIHWLKTFCRVVPRVVNERRDGMKSQTVFGLEQFHGIQRLHFPKIKPSSHLVLSIQDCGHPKTQPLSHFQSRMVTKCISLVLVIFTCRGCFAVSGKRWQWSRCTCKGVLRHLEVSSSQTVQPLSATSIQSIHQFPLLPGRIIRWV